MSDVVFCPVKLRKIGKREATLVPPMPATGEPEDIIQCVPLLKQKDGVGPYFEMLVQSESDPPPGGEPTAVCSGCGWEEIDAEKRQLVMRPSMWRGQPIFGLATTLSLIITDEFRLALEPYGFTNVEITSFPAA